MCDLHREDEKAAEYESRYAQGKLANDFAKAKLALERDRENAMVRQVAGSWYRVLRDESAKIARNRTLSYDQAVGSIGPFELGEYVALGAAALALAATAPMLRTGDRR